VLVNCPECKKEVSDRALSCPNCGYPIVEEPNTPAASERVSIRTDGLYIGPVSFEETKGFFSKKTYFYRLVVQLYDDHFARTFFNQSNDQNLPSVKINFRSSSGLTASEKVENAIFGKGGPLDESFFHEHPTHETQKWNWVGKDRIFVTNIEGQAPSSFLVQSGSKEDGVGHFLVEEGSGNRLKFHPLS